MGRKCALLIGSSEFQDPRLARLVTPAGDINALAAVLRDPSIGAFDDVLTFANANSATIRLEVESFFEGRRPDDLLVLYYSGHGIRNDQGLLFLATADTRHDRLRATAIPAAFVTENMDSSRSKRQVLILDCCHSGAFARGAKGVTGERVGTKDVFEGSGYGRVVLTATDATQYAWEGDTVIGDPDHSVFTHHLIEGMRTGIADADGDGQITVDELYDYAFENVVGSTSRQTPGKWSYRQQGALVIAKCQRPAGPTDTLPEDLLLAIGHSSAFLREGAVLELERLLDHPLPGLASRAQEALTRLSGDDSRRVSTAAERVLNQRATSRPPANAAGPTIDAGSAAPSAPPVSDAPHQPAPTEQPVAPAPEPTSLESLLATGQAHVAAGRYLEAIADFEQALALDPHSVPAIALLCTALMPLGRYAETITHYDRLVELQPNANLFVGRAAAHVVIQDFEQALADLRRALELDPGEVDAYELRGEVYFETARYEPALADFTRVVDLDPGRVLARINRAATLSKLGQPDEAVKEINRALESDPDNHQGLLNRAALLAEQNRFDAALRDLDRVIELDPTSAKALAGRGQLLGESGARDQALVDLNRAIELEPATEWIRVERGDILFRMGRYREALADFDRAIALNPANEWARLRRGQTNLALDLYLEALADFDRAIALGREDAWTLAQRGEVYRLLKRYDEALHDLNRAIEMDPKAARAFGSRGVTLRLMNKVRLALADLNRAIELDPANAWLLAQRAESYRSLGRLTDALDDCTRAIDLAPETGWRRFARARVLQAQGDAPQALKDLQAASELAAVEPANEQTDWRRRLNLALFRLCLGQANEAKALYEQAIAGSENAIYLEEALQDLLESEDVVQDPALAAWVITRLRAALAGASAAAT